MVPECSLLICGSVCFFFLYRYIKFKGYRGLDEYLSLGMTRGGIGDGYWGY